MFKNAARKIAHNSTLPALGGNKDLRPLQDLITAEKAVLISLQKLSVDCTRAAEAMKTWGLGEGEDLGDTLSASAAILSHFSIALSQYASHEHVIRDHLKSIRSREEALDELKRRRKSVVAEADSAEKKLNKMSPEHKNLAAQTDILNKLREDIRTLTSEIMTGEAQLGDFKRTTTRAFMSLKFGGLLECCEKGSIVAEFGKLVIAEIREDVTHPGVPRAMYNGQARTESLVSDAQRCVSEVVFSDIPPSESRRQPSDISQFQSNVGASESSMGPNQGGMGYSQGSIGFMQGNTGSSIGAFNNQGNIGASQNEWSPYPQQQQQPGYDTHFLATPQNLNQGHFMQATDATSASTPEINSYASPHPSQIHSPPESQPFTQSVDDFGVTQSPPTDSTVAAGRFATFPVKHTRGAGSAGGYELRDDPPTLGALPSFGASPSFGGTPSISTPPPIGASASLGSGPPTLGGPLSLGSPSLLGERIDEPGQSFASSVAAALGSSTQFTPGSPAEYQRPVGEPSHEEPTLSYQVAHTPTYAPPPGPPPGAAVANSWQDQQAARRQSQASAASSDHQLAYMTDAPAEDEHEPAGAGDRHVRFGGVSDVEEELQKRNESPAPAPMSVNGQGAQNNVAAPSGPPPSQGETSPPKQQPSLPKLNSSPPKDSSHRVPPPSIDPLDERALNAAAAREVSRELDALNFNPPAPPAPPPHDDPSRDRSPPSSLNEHSRGLPPNREPSPLAPPAPPFAQRSVSPRPTVDTTSVPYPPGSHPSSPTRTYTPAQTSSPTSLPSPRLPSPRFQTQFSSESTPPPSAPASPQQSHAQPTPPIISLPSRESIVTSNSPYRTPPEYPRSGSFPAPTPMNKSTSSLTSSPIMGGPRTISAAAFRRSPARGPSTPGEMGSPLTDTSPLSFKKRLPSSPYPQRPLPAAGPRDVAAASARVRAESNPAPVSATPSAEDDDQFDYISAYVDNMQNDPDHGAGRDPPPGYAQGRFATNLEGETLR